MTPDERITQLENTVAQLVNFVNSLGNSTTLPKDVSDAVASRIVGKQGKAGSTHTKAVNEGASAQYTVADKYDATKKIIIDGEEWDIGVYYRSII
jgi:hypothetical protein